MLNEVRESKAGDVDVSVIIVSFNTRRMTLNCLESVCRQTSGINYEVIVVDNDSTDGSREAIAEKYKDCKLMELEQNVGFSRGNNIGAGEAEGKYLLLLNPDTLVLDGAIQKLYRFAESNEDAGIYGGASYLEEGSLDSNSCRPFSSPWGLFCMAVGLAAIFRKNRFFNQSEYPRERFNGVMKADIVSGCFLLINTSLWKALKGLDPAFFMFGEEVDLCIRAKRHGNYCLFTPDARIIHYGGASKKSTEKMMVQLLSAKATIVRREWSTCAACFGLSMLWLWILRRLFFARLSFLVNPARGKESLETWTNVWAERKSWLSGY
jgi:N-acetylglucosaminyl-diphospho-decaprenol L-rhamnosyltransferase